VRYLCKWPVILGLCVLAGVVLFASGAFEKTGRDISNPPPAGSQQATFGSGCFWCTEAIFQHIRGVHSAIPGYSGGTLKNPTYRQVCTMDTGHAEVIQITFDPKIVSFQELLEFFWKTHDPTTPNRQGHDIGPQYRSVIFYHTEEQKTLAEHFKKQLDASGAFASPIVTEITAFSKFYPAEEYHQNYFHNNPGNRYCSVVIQPKLAKLEKVFKDKLKVTSEK
jgi:peptide-methionine (S)-S-oxide reductase